MGGGGDVAPNEGLETTTPGIGHVQTSLKWSSLLFTRALLETTSSLTAPVVDALSNLKLEKELAADVCVCVCVYYWDYRSWWSW